MRTLVATDLAKPGAPPFPWRTLRAAVSTSMETGTGAPPGPLATPAGYAFADADGSLEARAHRVEIVESPRQGKKRGYRRAPLTRGPSHRALPRVVVGAGDRNLPPSLANGLVLEVGEGSGRVEIDDVAWPHAAGPTLLAISQCWRLLQIEQELDDLDSWTRDHPGSHGRIPRRVEIATRLRQIRTLVAALVSVEGPLTDPRGYFDSSGESGLYRTIAARLGLRSWRERIDERVEVAEAAIEALVEERRHRQLMVYEVGLEVLILLALILDLGVNLWLLNVE